MSETSMNASSEQNILLEEQVEPLEPLTQSERLTQDEVVEGTDGQRYHVVTLKHSDTQIALYEALTEEGTTVWLREALSDSAIGRMRHETEVLAGMNYRMFPHVVDSFEYKEKTFTVWEALPTVPTLADLLDKGPIPLSYFLLLLAQVASALIRLHSQGWILLGLRPSVIALGKPVQILDFSYATRQGEQPAQSFYHAGYSPPELISDEAIDARADVYALGAVLFHGLNGVPVAETGMELGGWDPPIPLAGIPQVLHRCLGSRETRYTTMEELHHDLLRLARRYTPGVRYTLATATTIGLEPTRLTNQDAHACLMGTLETEAGDAAWLVACVSDGMGGMAAGEIASEVAVKSVLTEIGAIFAINPLLSAMEQASLVKMWVCNANERVAAAMEERGVRGGCTFVCVCLVNRRLAIAHVGDCRLYHFRERQITLLTRDHSLAMAMVLQGESTLDDIRRHPDRSKVTRSLGERQSLPDYYIDTLEPGTGEATLELATGDVLLLCSDGLWEPVLDDEMLNAIRHHDIDLQAAAETLCKIALQRGAPDNATLILIRIEEKSVGAED